MKKKDFLVLGDLQDVLPPLGTFGELSPSHVGIIGQSTLSVLPWEPLNLEKDSLPAERNSQLQFR